MEGRNRRMLILWGALWLAWLPARVAAEEPAAAPPPSVPVAESLRPIEPWLRHDDWTVRAVAVYDLRKHAEAGSVHVAARMLAAERHPYATACALAALDGRARPDLVMEGGPLLAERVVELARHAHPTVRARAFEILKKLPPVRLGDDLVRYEGWWRRGREALRLEQASLLRRVGSAVGERPAGPAASVPPAEGGDLYEHLERIRKHGLELCIVMDHTGSMSPVIAAAKNRAVALIRRLNGLVPGFRAGLVTYDDVARLRIPLTTNGEALRKAFNKVGAGGGGDWEEGVDKGVRMALEQDLLGWSQRAQRVIVVVGDAPPHAPDVATLVRTIRTARTDERYDHAVVVHAVSTAPGGVDHFAKIAAAGAGHHVRLRDTRKLAEELVVLSFGAGHRERTLAWLAEIDRLREAEPAR